LRAKMSRNDARKKRHARVRARVSGTSTCPRLCVFRSLKHVYAQLIDDESGHTMVFASSLEKEIGDKVSNKGNCQAARLVGDLIAKRALEAGVNEVVFDRNGYIYHGVVKSLAEGAREAGLSF
jgi:large subunit ribosomal protein L18